MRLKAVLEQGQHISTVNVKATLHLILSNQP